MRIAARPGGLWSCGLSPDVGITGKDRGIGVPVHMDVETGGVTYLQKHHSVVFV